MISKNDKISNGMKMVSVIPLAKGVPKEELTYFTAQEINPLSIVSVSLRNKKILGLAISVENAVNMKSSIKDMNFNLKKILEVKEESIFEHEYIESIFLANDYFVSKKNISIVSLLPSVLREEYDKISNLIKKNKKEEIKISNEIKKIKSEKLLFQAGIEDRISFYKTLIRESFAKKKSIFLILPTERDIDIFSVLLSRGIENFSISIHGNQSQKKQMENIGKIIENPHPVLVFGTIPFLSIPRHDFDIIIIEHESSNAYRMIASPHFDLRIFAEIYASKINTKFILADTLLSFETIAKKEIDNFGEVRSLSFKINFKGKLEIPIQNENTEEKEFKVLKDNSIIEIENTLAKKENVFLFSLRKGLATMTICRDCNQEVLCEKCMAPLVLYLSRDGKKRMFVCNRCKNQTSTETVCKNCGSWNLFPLGIGTDTVYEEVNKKFPNIKIFKFDRETIKTTKEAKRVITEFEKTPGSILVGTEMAIPYINESLPLSVIASFDSLWSIPNYKISEKIIQIITSIIHKTEKKLIIQTKNEQDHAIMAIKNENLLSFVREELEDRQKLGYPPYKRFIKITHLSSKEEVQKTRYLLEEMFKEYDPLIFSGFIAKFKNKYATNALIKLNTKEWSFPELSANSKIDENLLEKLLSLPPTFSINVDPEDLL